MKYKNAKDILPPELIEMLQDYYEGGYLYIPQRTAAAKRKETAYKVELEKRDQHIYRKYLEGWSREQLVSLYHLSESSLRRIILKQKRRYQEMKDNIKEMISRCHGKHRNTVCCLFYQCKRCKMCQRCGGSVPLYSGK